MFRFTTTLALATCTLAAHDAPKYKKLQATDDVDVIMLDEYSYFAKAMLYKTGLEMEKNTSKTIAVSGNPTTGFEWIAHGVSFELDVKPFNDAFTITRKYV